MKLKNKKWTVYFETLDYITVAGVVIIANTKRKAIKMGKAHYGEDFFRYVKPYKRRRRK